MILCPKDCVCKLLHMSNTKQDQNLNLHINSITSITSPTWVMISAELWKPSFPSSSRLNVRVGTDDAVWAAALTNITRSWHPIIPQLFATLTAVKMLSPAEKWTPINPTHAHLTPPLNFTSQSILLLAFLQHLQNILILTDMIKWWIEQNQLSPVTMMQRSCACLRMLITFPLSGFTRFFIINKPRNSMSFSTSPLWTNASSYCIKSHCCVYSTFGESFIWPNIQ